LTEEEGRLLPEPLSEAIKRLKEIYILSAFFGILIEVASASGKLTPETLTGLIIICLVALGFASREN